MLLEADMRYSHNGITIIFTEIPKEDDSSVYSFAVEDNEVMTGKLIKAVKNKEVTFEYIKVCAEALFVIIEEGTFTELASFHEVKTLFIRFENLFCEDPRFEFLDLSSPNRPWFRATLTNGNQSVAEYGEGRTKGQAKFVTLTKFFTKAI